LRKTYRVLAPLTVQTNLDRTKFPPWGVQGGCEAKPGTFTLVRHGGERRTINTEKGLALAPGDGLCAETAGGGGYGRPEARALEAIQRDLDAGYISTVGAERDYGAKVGADGIVRR
jgi:N-methylhydantoinase B/oxoprolinase/acetone carboxylase alpha subunit